jgi:hypothetical protein
VSTSRRGSAASDGGDDSMRGRNDATTCPMEQYRGESARDGATVSLLRGASRRIRRPAALGSLMFLLLTMLIGAAAGSAAAATPTASFTYSPSAPVTGQPLTLDASNSTCANTPCTYAWNVTSSGTSRSLGSGQVLTHTFGRSGTKVVTLTVTDASGQTDTDTQSFVVSVPGSTGPPTGAASFTFTPSSPVTGQAVTFDASTSTCAIAPCTYAWDDDGPDGSGGSNWPLGSGQVMTFTFHGVGTKYVRVTMTDAAGQTATVEHDVVVGSPGSGGPPPPAPPVSTGLPTISGAPQQGQTLTASAGTWSGSPTGYTYTWSDGSQGSSDTLTAADVGQRMSVTVTATNAGGSTNATSAAVGPVTAAPPSAPTNTALPTISGTARQGQTLSATTGSWTGSPAAYAYQWQDCSGTSCSNISGATDASYTLTSAEVGDTVDVVVTAHNSDGTGAATSASTATVTSSGGGGGNNCLQTQNSSGFNPFENPLGSGSYPNYADLDACGYPSPDTAGVPSGTSLTTVSSSCNCLPSGDSYSGDELYIGSTGTVSNVSMPDGYVVLGVSGATITDSLLRCNVCNQGGGIIAPQGNSLTITHSTIGGTGGGSDCTSPSSQDIGPSNGGGTLNYDVFDCSVEDINGSGYTLTNSYVIVDGFTSGSHNEDIYQPGGGSNTIKDNTLIDPLSSTASIFMDEKLGSEGTTIISGNLFSGAGYGDGMVVGGGGNVSVTNNRFSAAYGSSDVGSVCSNTTWSGNVMDSDGSTVSIPSIGSSC